MDNKNNMKKLKIIILIASILIIGSYIGYTFPRSLNKEFNGIQFRIGESDKEYLDIVKIKFDGAFSKNFIFGNTFNGNIYINDSQLGEYELKFDKFNRAILHSQQNKLLGDNLEPTMLIIDSGFNSLIICISELVLSSHSSKSYGWSIYDGLVIAAPAENRDEAANITSGFIAKSLISSQAKPT